MEMEYKQEVNDSYLILREEEGTEEDNFQLRMITENNIAGLLLAEKRNFNNESRIYYHIGSQQSLMQLQNKKEADVQMLKKLLIGINGILSTLTQYLLDADSLLLIPECIYFAGEEDKISFCLYPYEKRDIRQQVRELSEYFLERINREDEQAVSLAFQLYRMTREPNFVFSEIVEKLVHKEGMIYENQETQSTYKQKDNEWLADREQNKYTGKEKQSGNLWEQSVEERKEKQNQSKHKQDQEDSDSESGISGKRKLLLLNISLTVGSFLYVLYVYAVKQYFYGYSFLEVFGTVEAVFALGMFVVFLVINLFVYFFTVKKKL